MHIQFTYFPLSTFPVIHTEKKNHWKAQLEKFSSLQKKERGGQGLGKQRHIDIERIMDWL